VSAQREDDLRLLKELLELDDERVPAAFHGMLVRLDRSGYPLTPRQRAWANDVAKRVGVDSSDGPEEDGPEPTRLTSGPVPRGREVPIMAGPLPKRPPGRRT
jgi:hypothetical protein